MINFRWKTYAVFLTLCWLNAAAQSQNLNDSIWGSYEFGYTHFGSLGNGLNAFLYQQAFAKMADPSAPKFSNSSYNYNSSVQGYIRINDKWRYTIGCAPFQGEATLKYSDTLGLSSKDRLKFSGLALEPIGLAFYPKKRHAFYVALPFTVAHLKIKLEGDRKFETISHRILFSHYSVIELKLGYSWSLSKHWALNAYYYRNITSASIMNTDLGFGYFNVNRFMLSVKFKFAVKSK